MLYRGHEVTVFINYPKWACQKFSLPKQFVKCLWIHGVASRFITIIERYLQTDFLVSRLNMWFGAWATKEMRRALSCGYQWDVVFSMSGISLEMLKSNELKSTLRILARDSSHIKEQAQIMFEEEARIGVHIEKPQKWIIKREEDEYQLADAIKVLSSFNYETFLKQGIPIDKLMLNTSAFLCDEFKVQNRIVEERISRILSDKPVRVLFVGTVCFRKGIWDLKSIVASLRKQSVEFKLVGPVALECRGIFDMERAVKVVGKKNQGDLKSFYDWADLFIFPSLEEGFAQVLVHAASRGLPIMATQNSGASQMVDNGKTGWVFPIRTPNLFVEKLLWCLTHRVQFSEIVKNIQKKQGSKQRTWNLVAAEAEEAIRKRIRLKYKQCI